MTPIPPVRVGAAVLRPDLRLLRGPAGQTHALTPQAARLLARLAAAPAGVLVPWHELVEAIYAPGEESRAADGGRGVLAGVAVRARRALRETGARVGIATVKGGPTATGGPGGMRLDRAARDGVVVEQRGDRGRLLDARAQGVPYAALAERFGYASAQSARNAVWRARHADPAGGAP